MNESQLGLFIAFMVFTVILGAGLMKISLNWMKRRDELMDDE